MSGPGRAIESVKLALEDRRAERDRAETGEVAGRVIAQADDRIRKGVHQLGHRAEPDEVRRRGVEVRRVHQRVTEEDHPLRLDILLAISSASDSAHRAMMSCDPNIPKRLR